MKMSSPSLPLPLLQPPSFSPPLAANQLDSSLLDAELHSLLLETLSTLFLPPSNPTTSTSLSKRYDLEISCLLRMAGFMASTGVGRPTPGMVLQGLKHHSRLEEKGGVKVMFFLFTTIVPYIGDKVMRDGSVLCFGRPNTDTENNYAGQGQGHTTLNLTLLKVLQNLSSISKILTLLNFVTFLSTSIYPTLTHRLTSTSYIRDSLSSINSTPASSRPINFNFLERRLLWEGILRFLGAVSPLSDSFSGVEFLVTIGTAINRAFRWNSRNAKKNDLSSSSTTTHDTTRPGIIPFYPTYSESISHSKCGICFSPKGSGIAIPYVTNCSHVYCYVCLKKACNGNWRWRCRVCNEVVVSSKRVAGNVK